jgi:triacylglycerol esterase/lipase EstA (alpha/beta hydrolase family)
MLTNLQRNGTLPDMFKQYAVNTHFYFQTYGFDFKLQSQAFSESVFRDQAEFITQGINQVMSTGRYAGKNQKFTIIGHSLGCLTAKLVEKDLKHGTL